MREREEDGADAERKTPQCPTSVCNKAVCMRERAHRDDSPVVIKKNCWSREGMNEEEPQSGPHSSSLRTSSYHFLVQ